MDVLNEPLIKMTYYFNNDLIQMKTYSFNLKNIIIDCPFISFDLDDNTLNLLLKYLNDIKETKKYLNNKEEKVKMISADEARKLQNELNSTEEESQLKEVEGKIKKDIKKGYTYYYKQLCPAVQNKLERLGYKVFYIFDQRDGELTTIKW